MAKALSPSRIRARLLLALDGWTWNTAIRAEDTTIPGLRSQCRTAVWTLNVDRAGIDRHGHGRLRGTRRTGDDRFGDDVHAVSLSSRQLLVTVSDGYWMPHRARNASIVR